MRLASGKVTKMHPPLARPLAGKPVVSQDEGRLRMKEQQHLSTNRNRTGSPFAKYNRVGQLSCALGTTQS